MNYFCQSPYFSKVSSRNRVNLICSSKNCWHRNVTLLGTVLNYYPDSVTIILTATPLQMTLCQLLSLIVLSCRVTDWWCSVFQNAKHWPSFTFLPCSSFPFELGLFSFLGEACFRWFSSCPLDPAMGRCMAWRQSWSSLLNDAERSSSPQLDALFECEIFCWGQGILRIFQE